MAQGGEIGNDLRGDNRQTNDWLLRMAGKMVPDRQGVSTFNNQPGISSQGLQGYIGRGPYSPINSSNWQASLGLAPQANYMGGAYGGDSRVNTNRSAGIYQSKQNLDDTDSVQTYSKDGSVDYGGNRNIFKFGYGSDEARRIAEAGNIGLYARDRSGQSMSVNPMANLSEEQQWDKQTAMGGEGFSTEQGFYKAALQNPSDRIIFNNRINQNLAGEGNVSSRTLGDKGDNIASKTLQDVSRAIPMLSKIPLLGEAFKSYDKETLDQYDVNTAADQQMRSTGYLNQPGSAEYGVQSAGGMSTAMNTPGGYILSQSGVAGEQGGRMNMGRGGEGYLTQLNQGQASGGASLQDQQHEWKKMFGGEHQERTIRGGPQNLQAETGLMTKAGVKSNQALQQQIPQDWVSSNIDNNIIDNFETYRKRYPELYGKYSNVDNFIQMQYAKANPQASIGFNNAIEASQAASANGISSNVNAAANAKGNIAASGQGVQGDLQQASNSYSQDPSSFIFMPQFGTFAYVQGLKHWAQNSQTKITGNMDKDAGVLDVLLTVGGQLTGNNQLKQEMMRDVEDISAKMPQTEYGQILINKLKDSPELATLLNSNSSPETIAQTIVNYSVRKDETSRGVIPIPGVGVAQMYGAPVTRSSVSAKTSLEANIPRGMTREFDPTPNSPASGDEVVLANVNGQVRELQRGKLVSQDYIDTLTTSLTVPAGAATGWSGQETTSNIDGVNTTRYGAGNTPIDQQNQLKYSQYYFTPGENQQYNDLVTAGLNRYYDDNTGYDYSGVDPMVAEIQAGLANSPDGLYNGYTPEEWNYAIDLYNKQKEIDESGYNPFSDTSTSYASQIRYY